jgi:hypothetical protein
MSARNPDPKILQANFQALRSCLPETFAAINSAAPPATTEYLTSRDGSPTFAWHDESGAMHWLGRTTMPETRATALIEAFQPGQDNVLLECMGQGMEIRLLLARLAPYQAVVAIESSAWVAGLCLRLHDFSRDILDGRLLLFAGESGWTHAVEHLGVHAGYMTPRKILSWPWLDHASAVELSERVARANAAIDQARLEGRSDVVSSNTSRESKKPRLAIVSNVPSESVRRHAACLAYAAEQLGWAHREFVLDCPAGVHPDYVQAELDSLRPGMIVTLDASASELPYRLPDSRCTRVSTTEQGHDKTWWTAATVVDCDPGKRGKSGRIAVLANWIDPSASAAGLHLASHQKLWAIAERIITHRLDSYDDSQAGDVLAEAEKRLEARIENEGIRDGLKARIRERLGPSLVTMGHLRVISDAGLTFDLFGDGWQSEPTPGASVRGSWPLPDRLAEVVEQAGIVVSIETSGRLATGLLDAMAAGVPVMTRSTPVIDSTSSLSELLGRECPAVHYHSRAELLALLQQFRAGSPAMSESVGRAARLIRDRHTWQHRLLAFQAASK